MSQIISFGYGKENFSDASVSLMAFAVYKPFLRKLPQKEMKRSGLVQQFPSTNQPQFSGYLYMDAVEAPNNTLFLFQSSHRRKGVGIRDGAFFFVTREDGPNVAVRAALPAHHDSLNGVSFVVLQGRGDIVSPHEAASMFDLALADRFVDTWFNEDEIDECFTFQELSAGAPRPRLESIETTDGRTIAIPVEKRTRRLRIRK